MSRRKTKRKKTGGDTAQSSGAAANTPEELGDEAPVTTGEYEAEAALAAAGAAAPASANAGAVDGAAGASEIPETPGHASTTLELPAAKVEGTTASELAASALGTEAAYYQRFLSDDDHKVRAAALRRLAALDDPAALQLFIKAATDHSPRVRLAAIQGFVRLNARDHIDAIEPLAKDPDGQVKAAAENAIHELRAR